MGYRGVGFELGIAGRGKRPVNPLPPVMLTHDQAGDEEVWHGISGGRGSNWGLRIAARDLSTPSLRSCLPVIKLGVGGGGESESRKRHRA